MNPVWAQRREEVWSDCSVSPDVFTQMVNRLGEFVVPYQHALETEVSGGSVANIDLGAKSENRVSEIQWVTDPKTLEKANLRQNPV
jgi:hypothetical protein